MMSTSLFNVSLGSNLKTKQSETWVLYFPQDQIRPGKQYERTWIRIWAKKLNENITTLNYAYNLYHMDNKLNLLNEQYPSAASQATGSVEIKEN